MRLLSAVVIRLVLCFLAAGTVCGSGLTDEPIVGDGLQYLDGDNWVALSSSGLLIGATVPGDLITDLQRAAVIDDPFFESTWLEYSYLWDLQSWNYVLTFDLDNPMWLESNVYSAVYLVFDGVKMAADLSLNGALLGTATDQFLRYVFDVQPLLAAQRNKLQISFAAADPRIDPEVRFMACAGGWDWAPYSNHSTGTTPGGVRTLGRGVWRGVYLVPQLRYAAAITAVVPLVSYTGPYVVCVCVVCSCVQFSPATALQISN